MEFTYKSVFGTLYTLNIHSLESDDLVLPV